MAKSLFRMSPRRPSNVNQKRSAAAGSPITTFILLLAQPSATSTPHNSTNNNNQLRCIKSLHGIHCGTLCRTLSVSGSNSNDFKLFFPRHYNYFMCLDRKSRRTSCTKNHDLSSFNLLLLMMIPFNWTINCSVTGCAGPVIRAGHW